MHADQANQLEGYGYLVDGVGAFTYLGTVAVTAADYEAFGANLRLSNLAPDLSTAEKDGIKTKLSITAGSGTGLRNSIIRLENFGDIITINELNYSTYVNLGKWGVVVGPADSTPTNILVNWETVEAFIVPYKCVIKKFRYSYYSSISTGSIKFAIGKRDNLASGSFEAAFANPELMWESEAFGYTGGRVYNRELDLSSFALTAGKAIILGAMQATAGAGNNGLQRVHFQFEIEEIL